MKLTFFGTRGSLPSPSGMRAHNGEYRLFSTLEYGGNTTCFVIEDSEKKYHIIDAGSGIQNVTPYIQKKGEPVNTNIFITHPHWDHIQGFPFFGAAYNPQNTINIYGEARITGDAVEASKHTVSPFSQTCQATIERPGIKDLLDFQQNRNNFPAPLDIMRGLGTFRDFIGGAKDPVYIDDAIEVYSSPLNHPGGCVSYKFKDKKTGNILVSASDFEPDAGEMDAKLINWLKGADVAIMDAQYEIGSENNPFMKGFGHSHYKDCIFKTQQAGVKRLILTHHDPKSHDMYLTNLEERARKLGASNDIHVTFAKEGDVTRI